MQKQSFHMQMTPRLSIYHYYHYSIYIIQYRYTYYPKTIESMGTLFYYLLLSLSFFCLTFFSYFILFKSLLLFIYISITNLTSLVLLYPFKVFNSQLLLIPLFVCIIICKFCAHSIYIYAFVPVYGEFPK